MVQRRRVLQTLSVSLFGGCFSNINTGESPTDQAGPDGNPPPWAMRESPADVLVENLSSAPRTARLSIKGTTKSIQLPVSERWVSNDIFKQGENWVITVTTDNGLETTITWISEQKGINRIAQFSIRDEQIETEIWKQDE